MNARLRPVALASGLLASLALPLAASAADPYPSYSQQQSPVNAGSIPSGTTITGTLQTELDTGKSRPGDGFSILVTRPYPDGDASYANAVIRGHVEDVIKAGQGRKPQINLAFDSIVLSNGATAPLSGHVLTTAEKKKTAVLQQAAGAGVGMIVGNIIGKAIGTNLGGLVGAGAGFAYGNNRKTDFTVPPNTAITLQTDTQVPRPQARY